MQDRQLSLFEDHPLVTTKRVFRYPGSKITASKHLSKLVPQNITEIVSPFIGGGGFELYLTNRNIKIYGSDLLKTLVTLWNYILNDNKNLSRKIKEILYDDNTNNETLMKFQKDQYPNLTDELEKISYYWLFQCMAWNGMPYRGIFKYFLKNGEAYIENSPSTQLTFVKRLDEFYNPLITVTCCDYKEQLSQFPKMFAYLDPPYPGMPDHFYGNSAKYTSDFDHEELRNILFDRNSLWVLSYNDKELIRDLYSDDKFVIRPQWWKQSTSNRTGNTDLVIYPQELEALVSWPVK